MRFTKTLIAAAIATTALVGCNDETTNVYLPEEPKDPIVVPEDGEVIIAAYNLSFDHSAIADLTVLMELTAIEQDELIAKWNDNQLSTDDADHIKAERVIQIRNIAAVIQKTRPSAIAMKEFNNDGTGENLAALRGFRLNYLGVPQEIDGQKLPAIQYPYAKSFSTNTGLIADTTVDYDNDGKTGNLPGDAEGFGFHHGQYAFAMLSQYPITATRSFQKLKLKEVSGASNPVLDCSKNIPDTDPEGYNYTYCDQLNDGTAPATGPKDGDTWYSSEEWDARRMSSKNHVDVTISIPTADGTEHPVHLLISHPTPPIFDYPEARWNMMQNAAEIQFWNDYVADTTPAYIVDDSGVAGGINGESFIVLGDLNADPLAGDGDLGPINALMSHDNVNQMATFGVYAPKSFGAPECMTNGECRESDVPSPEMATSTSGLRLDHVIPSQDLNVVDSGVFWPATFEQGRELMNNELLGKYGNGKDVSSDHRLVWIKLEL